MISDRRHNPKPVQAIRQGGGLTVLLGPVGLAVRPLGGERGRLESRSERYGRQQGARKGNNPKKHGRPSHHPLLAVLAESHFILHGWLRSGNCGAARGAVEFLKEALALAGQRHRIRIVRADSGFFEDPLLSFLEQRDLTYIVVARLTRWAPRG